MYFQEDSRFVNHIKEMFTKANKGLHVLRSLCKEGYSQLGTDNLLKAIVLPDLVYGLSVYGASKAELSTVQCVLNRCFKCIIFLINVNICKLLEKQDRIIYSKIYWLEGHPDSITCFPKQRKLSTSCVVVLL